MKHLAGNFPATGAGGSVLEFEPPAPNARVIEPRNPLSSIGRASPCELFSIPALLLGWQSGSDALVTLIGLPAAISAVGFASAGERPGSRLFWIGSDWEAAHAA